MASGKNLRKAKKEEVVEPVEVEEESVDSGSEEDGVSLDDNSEASDSGSAVLSDASESEDEADFETIARPAKRRRVSDIEDEDDDDNEPYIAPAPVQTISRIKKAKTAATPTTASGEDPITIADAIASDPHRDSKVPIFASLDPEIQTTSTTFGPLGVAPWLVTSLTNMAIRRPTAIQKACIPEILKGRDCLGGSRTGSGKTMAFAVPILQKWAEDPVGVFAVVLTPTRELALQIFEQFKAISSTQGLKPLLITGGTDMRQQAIALSQRPHIVIATPGRLADHITNSGADTISGLKRTRIVVLDEADRLLSSTGPGSMLPDVETCMGAIPSSKERQTLLFTATVTPEVRALKEMPRQKGKLPIFVTEIQVQTTTPAATKAAADSGKEEYASILPPTLSQSYLLTPLSHRDAYLHVLLNSLPSEDYTSIIVFVNRTSTATLLSSTLRHLGHSLTSLHSGLPQSERTENLSRFRAQAVRILVATDVAARGLDIPNVRAVINRDVPRDPADYIHRVGRTARAGRLGEAITMVGQRDVEVFRAIEARVFGVEEDEEIEESERPQINAWELDGVNIDSRILKDGVLRDVSKAQREARIETDEGRDWRGKRKAGVRKLK